MDMHDTKEREMFGVPLFKFAGDENIQKLQDDLIKKKASSFAMEDELKGERTSEKGKDKKISYNALILNTFPPLEEYDPPMDASAYSSPNLSYKQRKAEYKRWKKQHAVYVPQGGEFAIKPKEQEKKSDEESYKKLSYEIVEKDGKKVKEQKLVDYTEVRDQKLFLNKEWREEWASTKMGSSNLTRREIIEMVGKGDYSHFENLDDTMRNMFAKEALDRLVKKYADGQIFKQDPQKICEEILGEGGVSALLDAPLRLGLSLAQRENRFYPEASQKNWFQKLDEQMSAAVMLETLKQKDENELKSAIAKELVDKQHMNEKKALKAAQDMVEADKAQKIQTAKRLLLMHIGEFKQIDERKEGEKIIEEKKEWTKPVAVALSHCSRVMLELPKCHPSKYGQKEYKKMWNSIFYQKGEKGEFNSNLAQDKRRAASTHSIKFRKGVIAVEKKVAFNLRGQRGMNVAIGGLGNQGIGGKMILNDGSCGHFYSMYKEGDTKRSGAILMGLESDCPGTMNQLGHTHDIRATAEKASSLGGQRADEVGRKYGGRKCYLGNTNPGFIARAMDILEEAMKKNLLSIDDMKLLVGPPMKHIGHFTNKLLIKINGGTLFKNESQSADLH